MVLYDHYTWDVYTGQKVRSGQRVSRPTDWPNVLLLEVTINTVAGNYPHQELPQVTAAGSGQAGRGGQTWEWHTPLAGAAVFNKSTGVNRRAVPTKNPLAKSALLLQWQQHFVICGLGAASLFWGALHHAWNSCSSETSVTRIFLVYSARIIE